MQNNSWLTPTNVLLLFILMVLVWGTKAVMDSIWVLAAILAVIGVISFLYKHRKDL